MIAGTGGPVEAYLDMDKIIALALKDVDAIHPGYGSCLKNSLRPEVRRSHRLYWTDPP